MSTKRPRTVDRRSAITALTACALAAVSRPSPAVAQATLRTVTYGQVTKSAFDWPSYIADALGYYADAGIKVDFVVVGGAAKAAQQLAGASLDVGLTTTLELVEAVNGGAPLVDVITRDVGSPYVVVGRKGLVRLTQLRGKTLVVGGVNDNTRVYMDTVLAHAGLKPEDYTYIFAGNSADRFAALLSGSVEAPILAPPFSFQAQANGFPVLDEVAKYYVGFPQNVIAANVGWAKAHPDLVVAFLKAHLRAVRFFYVPANRDKCLQILVDAIHTSPELAAQSYDLLYRIKSFSVSGTNTPQQWGMVFDVLLKTNQIKPPIPPLSTYVDTRYLDEAAASLRRRG